MDVSAERSTRTTITANALQLSLILAFSRRPAMRDNKAIEYLHTAGVRGQA